MAKGATTTGDPSQAPTTLRIYSKTGKIRYRSRFAFPPNSDEPVELLVADLTEDEIAELRGDTDLAIQDA